MALVHELSNGVISIAVAEVGAELQSLRAGGVEYLWQGDEAYWGGRSPWLFPIVGSVWREHYRHEGTTYALSRHGFAKASRFDLVEKTADTLVFELASSADTLAVYPFEFRLVVSYSLRGSVVECAARVENTGAAEMHYQIGGHPGLNYHDFVPGDNVGDVLGYIGFNRKALRYILVGEGGCAIPDVHYDAGLDGDGLMPIHRDTFDKDALIFQDSQITEATLYDKARLPRVKMTTDAPITAFWAACDGNAPYVCFEPWHGRCDRVNYEGEFALRDFMQHLAPGEAGGMAFTLEVL